MLSQTFNDSKSQILYTVDISSNNSLILTGSNDGNLRTYVKQSNLTFNLFQTLLEQGYPVLAIDVSKDMSQIVTGSMDTRVRIYSHTKNGYILNQTLMGGTYRVSSSVFYDDNSGVLVSSSDGRIRLYRSCFSVLYGCGDCLSAIFCSSCS